LSSSCGRGGRYRVCQQPKNGRVEDLQSTSNHIRYGTVPIAITPTTHETGFVGNETSSGKTGKSVEYAPGKGIRDE
jgi:hypothetical protein